ncbi:MAG: SDR family oxidoreductase [Spirochaetales bacterium]|nr:SDR family oxidoreductase [Spirochaetales bacterium]
MKTIFITGASSGMGKAVATYAQKRGWQVAATMRSPQREKELAVLDNVKCFKLDVTKPESIKKAFDLAVKAFGKIDVVLNNAGYSLIGPFETTTVDDIKRQYDTNVFGLMNVVREILPHLRKNKGGTIINVASIGGRIGFPLYSLYNGSKFAVEGFSESLQHELRPLGIRVKIIEPGVIKTDFYGRSMAHTHKTGIADYDPYVQRTHQKMMAMGENGITPEKAAKKIYKAVKSKSWRMRYSIGADAKAILFIRRMFPFGFLRWILRCIT